MNILFIHQNFPGQYGRLAAALAAVPGNRVVALGEKGNLARRVAVPAVETIAYLAPAPAGRATHPYLRTHEAAVRRGQQVARSLMQLRSGGFSPDIVCAHPGWGEALFVKDVFPAARLLGYFEFFYRAHGADVGFDPQYPATLDDHCRVRSRNATMLLSLDAADAGVTPTHWQHRQFPEGFRPKIAVVHEGIDTDLVCPDPGATLTLSGGKCITRADKVVTFVARNLEPYRGFHVFLRMLPGLLARCPQAHILVVGGDDVSYGAKPAAGKTYRQLLLDELGGTLDLSRVFFLGRIPYGTFLSVLRVSTVHAYLTYPFVLSWSLLEAMSAGCMVIGSRTPPVEEVISDGVNGWLCDFFDREEWANRVADAIEAGAALDHLRAAARATVQERYDLARVCLPEQLALVRQLT